jgi:hypothetical protein
VAAELKANKDVVLFAVAHDGNNLESWSTWWWSCKPTRLSSGWPGSLANIRQVVDRTRPGPCGTATRHCRTICGASSFISACSTCPRSMLDVGITVDGLPKLIDGQLARSGFCKDARSAFAAILNYIVNFSLRGGPDKLSAPTNRLGGWVSATSRNRLRAAKLGGGRVGGWVVFYLYNYNIYIFVFTYKTFFFTICIPRWAGGRVSGWVARPRVAFVTR